VTSSEASALDLLLQRLTWPSGLVRERACVSLGSLMADSELGGEVASAVLAWMAVQKLESLAVLGLLAFFQAKARGFPMPPSGAFCQRISKPSLLSWLIARSLYTQYIGDPAVHEMHAGTAPLGFEADPFFLKYAESFVPPVYLERARRIDSKHGSAFLARWMFEWTGLVELTGLKLHKPYVDFWTRRDDDYLLCLDLPLSEVYRSAFLRALSWAVDGDVLSRSKAVWLAGQTCPIDLGLWQVFPGRQPDAWPSSSPVGGSLDTIPGVVTSELAGMWQRQLSDEWSIAGASGRIYEGENSAYDLQIMGVIQACDGPHTPEIDSLDAKHAQRTISWAAPDLMAFGGKYGHEPADGWQEQHSDWSIWRLATRARLNTIPRWQWWRSLRGVWLPSPFLARESFEFRCTDKGVIIEEDGREVARWTDWTHNLREMTTANLTPSTGQMLLIHRSLIEREAAKLGGVFAWICRITGYHRKFSHSDFTEAGFTLDFGTTRIVRDTTQAELP
jgi:hypothetical protein